MQPLVSSRCCLRRKLRHISDATALPDPPPAWLAPGEPTAGLVPQGLGMRPPPARTFMGRMLAAAEFDCGLWERAVTRGQHTQRDREVWHCLFCLQCRAWKPARASRVPASAFPRGCTQPWAGFSCAALFQPSEVGAPWRYQPRGPNLLPMPAGGRATCKEPRSNAEEMSLG